MHGHAPGFLIQWVAARGDQPQTLDPEIGAEPGNAADVEGTRRFHQHQHKAGWDRDHRHSRLCRWASRSATLLLRIGLRLLLISAILSFIIGTNSA